MARPLTALALRAPAPGWMITAVLLALGLYGLSWFGFSLVVNLADPLIQTRQLMISAVFWMICALVMWNLSAPPSRLHALLNVLTCVFFVSLMGTIVAFASLILKGAEFNTQLLTSFSLLSGALLVAQLFLAIPAGILLQQVALARVPSP